jgi:hypothetical protein
MGKVLAVALCAGWVATLAFADTAVTPAMHCPRGHKPCCPQSGSGESCSTARCTEQIPEKAEARVLEAPASETQAAVAPVRIAEAQRSAAEPARELTAGLHYHAPIFRLKDDLRI